MITEPFSVALFKEFDRRDYKYFLIDSQRQIYQVNANGIEFLIIAHGTITYMDSLIGNFVAQSKYSTNIFLKENNYPHTTQILVKSILNFDVSLNEIGYPLVMKPIDYDNGKGVFCNLYSKNDIIVFLNENKHLYGNGVIFEKYVSGNDYRIMVLNNKFAFAVKRTPPIIIGNGKSTVRELINSENKKLKEKFIENQVQKTIPIDTELEMILRKNNITMNSILNDGEIIKLKSISNLSVGGNREIVDEKEIHPEVIKMCELISKKLNIFSLGIDYITEDISKPPVVGKDAIIELNNNPQLSGIWVSLFIDRVLEAVENNK